MEVPDSVTGFNESARSALAGDPAFSVGEDAAENIRRRVDDNAGETTPKTGNPTKAAKEAQKIRESIAMVAPLLSLTNESVADRWPELRYSDGELEVFSTLAGAVLAKHMPVDAAEYEEEFKLALFVAGTGVQKGKRLYARLKAEKKKGDDELRPNRDPSAGARVDGDFPHE